MVYREWGMGNKGREDRGQGGSFTQTHLDQNTILTWPSSSFIRPLPPPSLVHTFSASTVRILSTASSLKHQMWT